MKIKPEDPDAHFETCPMFGDRCRHCSVERAPKFTPIRKDPRGTKFRPAGTGKMYTVGEYCNNHAIGQSGWIREMHYCPRRFALRNPPVAKATGLAPPARQLRDMLLRFRQALIRQEPIKRVPIKRVPIRRSARRKKPRKRSER